MDIDKLDKPFGHYWRHKHKAKSQVKASFDEIINKNDRKIHYNGQNENCNKFYVSKKMEVAAAVKYIGL